MGYMSAYEKQMSKAAKEDTRSNEELVQEILKGHTELAEILFYKNFGLITRFIRPFFQYYDQDDLYQQAYLGLHDAIFKFDPSRGKFTNVIQWYVLVKIRDYDKHCKSIPYHLREDIILYNCTFNELRGKYGRNPHGWEVADELCWTIEKAEEIDLLSLGNRSFEELLPGQDDNLSIGDTIEDVRQSEMLDRVVNDRFMEETWQMIESIISDVEKEILFLVIDGGLSINQVAKQKGVDRKTILNIYNEAITKLRLDREFKRFLEKSESLFCSSYLYGDGFNSFKRLQGSRVEESVIRKDKIERGHRGRVEVIEANHSLKCNQLASRLHK